MKQGKLIRGLVSCKDCMKARCIYSSTSPSRTKHFAFIGDAEPIAVATRLCREYAMHKFNEAQSSEYFVCGMQPFDVDNVMHRVIVPCEGLECHYHIEFEYNKNNKIPTSHIFNSKL